MSQKYETTPPLTDRMPGGIPYIVGNEAAERFSFYGMKTILFIFMTQYLLGSGGKHDVLSPDEAKEYVHYFVSAAYFFPIFGAILSDVLLGKYRTILFLSVVYCFGHLALALDETRLGMITGLGLIAIGSGGIKPCVSAHVGDQFGEKNKQLISRVFQWFYFAINLGAFASTLLTPWLLAKYGPGVAFGVPGLLMLSATIVFWKGRHKFVHIPPAGMRVLREVFSGPGLRAILNLSLIYLCVSMFWALFDQTGSAWIDQARGMDKRLLGITWYTSQIQAANPIMILLFIPLFAYVIYPLGNRVFTLTPLRKIGIGFFVCAAAFATSAWIESGINGGQIVPFKRRPSDEVTRVASLADGETWPAENLIDGRVDGSGWAAKLKEDGETSPEWPQEVVIRLRQRRPWKIDAVEMNPYTVPPTTKQHVAPTNWIGRFVQNVFGSRRSPLAMPLRDFLQCWAKDVEVFVSDARVGPWRSVGEIELSQRDAMQRLTFPPTEAEYVMIRVLSNHGGPFATLGEVAVMSAGDPPINVAATGRRPNIAWQLLAYALITAAEILISITALEFSYTQAPPSIKSFIMAIYLLSISLGNFFTASVNRYIQNSNGSSKLEGANYYWFFTASMLATALIFLVVARFYRGQTYIQGGKEAL